MSEVDGGAVAVAHDAESPKKAMSALGAQVLGGQVVVRKKIIVCCDGTGNEFRAQVPHKKDKEGNSNVVKLYTALDLKHEQIAYYHPGVGTMGDPSKKGPGQLWARVKGLAFGWGFRDNVLDAYRYLMQHYNAGDTVYILGFSRGAYTARALAGFLHGYGLLCRGNEGHIQYAWNLYTAKLKKQRSQNDPQQTLPTDFAFRDTFSHSEFMMHFVGLWDTVSSVGWISTPMRLLHLAQNPSIITGRHAVSIDERRCFYHDNLWGEAVPVQVPPALKGKGLERMQDLLQVWFPGVHSDVGGSYGQYSSGLANGSLQWMMEEMKAAGAEFKDQRWEAVLGGPVLNDPQGRTTSLQCLYPRPTSWRVHVSLKCPWWILEIFPHRYYNTDADKKEILRIPWGAWRRLPEGAVLHKEVLTRLAKRRWKYRPPNLTCGTILPIAEGPRQGYGLFHAPLPKPGWRENRLVVFAVKSVLTAIPVLVFRLLGLFLMGRLGAHEPRWACALAMDSRCWSPAAGGVVAMVETWIRPWGAVAIWSLVVAAGIVLFWTLVRLVRPRS